MEVEINVWAVNQRIQEKRSSNRAYFTLVSMDEDMNAVAAPTIVPETDEERHAFEQAARRRELRLILAGRLNIKDARHLSDLSAFPPPQN
jgi:acyl-CoA hydrolase